LKPVLSLTDAELAASVKSLQDRLQRAEKKISTAESTTKRIIKERDAVVQQIGVAFYNSEELKTEVDGLRNENKILQDQVTDLQTENRDLTTENEDLRAQLDDTHDRHDENTQKWTTKEAALKRKATTVDRDMLQENHTLREELVQLRQRQEEEARRATHKEAEVRRKAEKAAQAEHAKLAHENDQLKAELEQAKSIREAEMKRWKVKQAELKARVDGKEETIHQLQAAVPQGQVNEELRQQNEELKVQVAKYKADSNVQDHGTPKDELRRRLEEVTTQRHEETQRWSKKESRLRDRLDKAREVNELNRRINDIRGDSRGGIQAPVTSHAPTDARSKRKSTGQINVHDSISEQIDREMQKNRSASAALPTTSSSKLRSRSKSRSRTQPRPEPRNLRHSSAPAMQDDEDSDNSTTNLSFEQANAGTRRSVYQTLQAGPAHTGDTTFLSFIDGNEIAKLRKKLEEEHALARKRRSGLAVPTQDHRSKANSTRNLTHKSSLKDLTGRSKASTVGGFGEADSDVDSIDSDASEHERQSTKQDTQHSNLSRAESRSQRRRSGVFAEMTSAFIVPDITLQARISTGNMTGRSILDKFSSPPHNTTACTVCQRIIGTNLPDSAIPAPVPVSTRPEVQADIDATMRPTQGPIPALGRVLKELQDELIHLKLELHVVESKLQQHDPALGKRVRNSLHEKLDVLNKAIQSKSEQIYALYDVVEAHKDELANGVVPEEIERTMESIRVGGTGTEGKRVNFGGAGRRYYDDESEEETDEAPWAGISDTESLHRR
jgi:predicted  nucleic acid-binding Zn-ribbon protein